MTKHYNSFLRDEHGATAIEYGLLCAMMGTILVSIANSSFGLGINQGFLQLGDSFQKYTSF
jgi:Flp pilus assembly pilin Flp